MVVLLSFTAIASGIAWSVALWPFSPVAALLAAPFVASTATMGMALMLAKPSHDPAPAETFDGKEPVLL